MQTTPERKRRKKNVRRLVDPGSPSAEPFRSLRLALQLRPDEDRQNIVVFTSADPGDGKTTIAANYALISALSQDSVLLIDGDFRRPELHNALDVPRSPGLSDALMSGGQLESVARPLPVLGNLDFIPAGRPIPRTGDFSSSKRMGDFLAQASARYGLVVIDAPPLLTAADAAGLASHASVEVVMVVNRSTRRREVTKALRKLELIEARVAGMVVNRHGRLANYAY
jgi:capsular exopolysaccharide synthesis family protein